MRLIHEVIEDLRKLPDHAVTPMGAAMGTARRRTRFAA